MASAGSVGSNVDHRGNTVDIVFTSGLGAQLQDGQNIQETILGSSAPEIEIQAAPIATSETIDNSERPADVIMETTIEAEAGHQ